MRITTIDTTDQREAVSHAAAAAVMVRAIFPTAEVIELASETVQKEDTTKYEVFNIWGPADEHEQKWLWSNFEHKNLDKVSEAARDRLQQLLALAGETDPNVFGPDELAAGAWELVISKVLKVQLDDHVDQVVNLIESSGIADGDLWDLIHDAADETDADDVADKAEAGGVEAQAKFLVERLGYDRAVVTVQSRA